MILADVESEHVEAELVRGILLGGGLSSQWGIVSIQRVQTPGTQHGLWHGAGGFTWCFSAW